MISINALQKISVKRKLIFTSFISIGAIFLLAFLGISILNGLDSTANQLLVEGSSLEKVNSNLSSTTDLITKITEQQKETNRFVMMLEMKVRKASNQLKECTNDLNSAAGETEDEEMQYTLEDAADITMDIEEKMRREVLTSLKKTMSELTNFSEELTKGKDTLININSSLNSTSKTLSNTTNIFSKSTAFGILLFLIITGITVIITSILTYLSITSTIKPIRNITSVAREISQGNLDSKVDNYGESELGILSNALNKMSKDLKESNEDSSKKIAVLDENPSPIIFFDPEFNITTINRAAKEMFSIDEKIIGKNCSNSMNDNFFSKVSFPLSSSNKLITLEKSILPLSNIEYNISCTALAIMNDNKEVTGGAFIITDLTKMVQEKRDIEKIVKNLTETINNLSDISNIVAEKTDLISNETSSSSLKSRNLKSDMEEATELSREIELSISSASETTNELATAANDIAQNMEEAQNITNNAVKKGESVIKDILSLKSASENIEKIIEIIIDIAEQTKFLSLNATIEAARAGVHGQGFAVVADEIKKLAHQTQEATDTIGESIQEIFSATDITTKGVIDITEIIDKVNERITTIAAASEEQNVATSDIANNLEITSNNVNRVTDTINTATTLSSEISENISSINIETETVSASSEKLIKLNDVLSNASKTLDSIISE